MGADVTLYALGTNGELYLDIAVAIHKLEERGLEADAPTIAFLRRCYATAAEHHLTLAPLEERTT